MRAAGRLRMAFYPQPLSEAQRIRRFLLFPTEPVSALDPCVGDGVAFEAITSGGQVLRYGIELDAYRADQARVRVAEHATRQRAGGTLRRRHLRSIVLQPALRLRNWAGR